MLNLETIREQVYHYLRHEMQVGELYPGSSIETTKISKQFGISKTPLRDALIRLESEGFLDILPRRGAIIRTLTLQDIENYYEILGSLEACVINSIFNKIGQDEIEKMELLNANYKVAVLSKDFEGVYQNNLDFHSTFLDLSQNDALLKIMKPLKQRLYDFPRRNYLVDWELRNVDDHQQFLDSIKKGNREGAVHIWKDVHWSYSYQETFIREYYTLSLNAHRSRKEKSRLPAKEG